MTFSHARVRFAIVYVRLRLQNEEWEKFQNDLLTSVRVANDFKTEAQQNVQKLILENKAERERVRLLEAQIDKLKGRNLWFFQALTLLMLVHPTKIETVGFSRQNKLILLVLHRNCAQFLGTFR